MPLRQMDMTDIFKEPKQDDINNDKQSVDLAKITCPTAEDDYAKPINERWAKIVKDNWATKTLNENLRNIINNHKSPENCTLKPPSVNPQIWKLLSSWQKKSDVKFSSIQKSMVKSLNASLVILEQLQTGTVDLQFITQSTADIAGMLGHAIHEISLKSRTFYKSVIKDEYRYLCSISQEITDYFFGDNLEERIKEVNLTNRLANNKPQYRRVRPERVTGSYRPYSQRSQSNCSFLGRDRGTCHRHNFVNVTEIRKARNIKSRIGKFE